MQLTITRGEDYTHDALLLIRPLVVDIARRGGGTPRKAIYATALRLSQLRLSDLRRTQMPRITDRWTRLYILLSIPLERQHRTFPAYVRSFHVPSQHNRNTIRQTGHVEPIDAGFPFLNDTTVRLLTPIPSLNVSSLISSRNGQHGFHDECNTAYAAHTRRRSIQDRISSVHALSFWTTRPTDLSLHATPRGACRSRDIATDPTTVP